MFFRKLLILCLLVSPLRASNNSDINELKKEAPNYFERIDKIFVEMTGNHATHDELWHFGMNMADGNTDEKELRRIINIVKAEPGYVQGPLQPIVVCKVPKPSQAYDSESSPWIDALHIVAVGAEALVGRGIRFGH